MLDSIEAVLAAIEVTLIAEHRHTNVELKQSWAQDDGKKIAALANKTGISQAWLLVGIDDEGLPTGQGEEWARQTEQVISQQLNRHLDPIQACAAISPRQTGKGWVVVIEVVPPGAVTKWANRAYKASGTTQAVMKPDEELELTLRLPGLVDYSRQEWIGNVEEALARDFISTLAAHRPDDARVKAAADTRPEGFLRELSLLPRQAARLLFGNTSFRLVVLNAAGTVLRNDVWTGLWRLLGPEFLAKIRELGQGAGWLPSDFVEPAVREALANMVAHAAYFDRDGELIVEIRPDALVLSNLCSPELAHFANKWFSRSHKSANAFLMETLRLAGVVDELGLGKTRIAREYLTRGFSPPSVIVEAAGRTSRWKLTLPAAPQGSQHKRLLERCRKIFSEHEALIAVALVYWRSEPVSHIRKYVDDESAAAFVSVLENLRGPVFLTEAADRLTLNRWAEILIGEGQDSKQLSPAEDRRLYRFAYKIHRKYHEGVITNQQLREMGSMGDSNAEQALASRTLRNWVDAGRLSKERRGVYRFVPRQDFDAEDAAAERTELLTRLLGNLTGSVPQSRKQ